MFISVPYWRQVRFVGEQQARLFEDKLRTLSPELPSTGYTIFCDPDRTDTWAVTLVGQTPSPELRSALERAFSGTTPTRRSRRSLAPWFLEHVKTLRDCGFLPGSPHARVSPLSDSPIPTFWLSEPKDCSPAHG